MSFSDRSPICRWLLVAVLTLAAGTAMAHGVSESDAGFLQGVTGVQILPFIYLGAKHMVTGYDHLLFLVGVIFFLYRMKDIGIYVTLFAVGHSTTLLMGVLNGWHINAYVVDAIIGLSIVYRAFDNLGWVPHGVRHAAKQKICSADFWILPWPGPGDQTAGLCVVEGRADFQHGCV